MILQYTDSLSGGKRGGRAPKAPRPASKTAEELDAEMTVRVLHVIKCCLLTPFVGVQDYHCIIN